MRAKEAMKGAACVLAVGLVAGAGAGCAGGDDGGAQGVPEVQLGEAEAVWAEAFAVVSTVRELPDGRVLVADPLGQVVVSLDMEAGVADTIGGVGEGPAEYRQPDAVWPLPGDRTLLVDLGNGRLTVLSPELEFGDTRPYAVMDPAAGTMAVAIPQGVDAMGRVYFRGLPGLGEMTDSAKIVRMNPETGDLLTVGMFKQPDVVREESGGPNNQNVSVTPVPLSPQDAWGVAQDGRVVVVRAGDYHVDWLKADGSITSGPPVPYAPVSIGQGEKEEWRDGRSETGGGMSISVGIANGDMRITASRGGALDDDDALDAYPWPEVKPAFFGQPVPVDRMGRAWVRRHQRAGSAPRYDLFDGTGVLVMSVELPMNRRVVGFGESALFAVRMNEFGLQYLERYAVP
ncbi:MAG: hypothetical protein OXF01_02030 [Gemmatimonadetes bacterium]|nr:hypothetical protein [Gemmatimonadota bacterium]